MADNGGILKFFDLIFDAGIEDTSNYINTKLTKYIIDGESHHPKYVIYHELM